MAKKLCKGIRKDGLPCRAYGLDKYNGYCSAHGSPLYQGGGRRAPGGKSAAAARLDRRTPEWIQEILDLHQEALKKVKEGSLSPEAYASVCRGIKLKLEIYRRAGEEMGIIRAGKRRAPAAKPRAGKRRAAAAKQRDARADLELLKAADLLTARQDRYRSESRDAHDLAESENPSDPDEPPKLS
ncbi:MAG: hypothetical protein OXG26_02225 [Caldilineaceae bacterium]|nr:hypothetical protein [Caldilineaceae bacterium]